MWRYRCGTCRTTSPIVRSRMAVLNERDRHRRIAHGGHVPDGEQLLRHRGWRHGPTRIRPAAAAVVLIAVLLLALITRR